MVIRGSIAREWERVEEFTLPTSTRWTVVASACRLAVRLLVAPEGT
jgi:hypothetical protein